MAESKVTGWLLWLKIFPARMLAALTSDPTPTA